MGDPQTIEEIITAVDKELEVDVGNLGAEALRQGKIFTTIQRLYEKAVTKLNKLAIQLDATKHHRTRYYLGKLSPEEYIKEPLRESILKGDIESYVKIDPKVVKVKLELQQQEAIVKFLEEAKWRVKGRGEEIRLCLDFQRMQLGV